MERKNIYSTFRIAITSFLSGVIAVMSLVVLIPLIISKGDFSVLSRLSWRAFFLEIILLTVGFFLMSLLLIKKISLKRWRVFLAGVSSVILLGWLSIFTQGASLLMITTLSLLAGIFSTFSLLPFSKRPIL